MTRNNADFQGKLPHQMSPEEFASSPASVFHGTFLPDEKVLDVGIREPASASGAQVPAVKKMHLGTFQAALDAVHERNRQPDQKATIHTFWQTPRVNRIGGKMPELADPNPEDEAHFKSGAMYYANQNEDWGNPSFATETPKKHLKTQAEYVSDALAQGKESEVHPRTLEQYRKGTLGKMQLNPSQVELMITSRDKLGPLRNAGPQWDYLRGK